MHDHSLSVRVITGCLPGPAAAAAAATCLCTWLLYRPALKKSNEPGSTSCLAPTCIIWVDVGGKLEEHENDAAVGDGRIVGTADTVDRLGVVGHPAYYEQH